LLCILATVAKKAFGDCLFTRVGLKEARKGAKAPPF